VRFSGEAARIQTVYLGSRTSERYGRVYDKLAESRDEHYRHCWRWEVEVKGEPAGNLADRLVDAPDAAGQMLALLSDYFSTAGVAPPLIVPRLGERWQIATRSTDDARRLRWLAEQVRPVLDGLTARGWGTDARSALGLPPEGEPAPP
jgi:DNA relaxase NicK